MKLICILLLLTIPSLSFSQRPNRYNSPERKNTVYGEILGSSTLAGFNYERLIGGRSKSAHLITRVGVHYAEGLTFSIGAGPEFGRERSRLRLQVSLSVSPIDKLAAANLGINYIFRGWNGFYFNTGIATWYLPEGFFEVLPVPGVSFGYSF